MPEPVPVVSSSSHLAHDGLVEVMGGKPIPCFEKPERITEIERALASLDWVRFVEPIAHGREPITAVHDQGLIDLLEHVWADALSSGQTDGGRPLIPDTFLVGPYAAGGYGGAATKRPNRLGAHCLDTATPIVEGTFRAALAAVDVALTGADLVTDGAPLAYALCRPPGHHAARSMYGGYCFFNNAAIVAQRLRQGGRRVAVLDIDYHHGNGTQQLFWDHDDVLYVSLHGDPTRAFPYFSGHADEVGAGRGTGFNRNFPLPAGADAIAYLALLDEACGLIARFAPDAPLIVSLGFDTYADDPICDLALRTEDYGEVAARIASLGLPTILIQEGGYAIEAIGANAMSFLRGYVGTP